MVDGENEETPKNYVFRGLVFSIKSQPLDINPQVSSLYEQTYIHYRR